MIIDEEVERGTLLGHKLGDAKDMVCNNEFRSKGYAGRK